MTTHDVAPPARRPATVIRALGRRLRDDPSSALLVAQLVTAAVAFVVNIFAARILQPSGRGELALLLQIAYLASLGLLLGTDRSTVAVYSGESARSVTRVFLRLLRTPSTVGLVAVAAVLAVPVPGLDDWRIGLALALAFAVVNAFVRAVRSVAIAADRQRSFLAYTLTGEALRLAVLATLMVAGVGDVVLWMLAYLVVGLAPTVGWLLRWSTAGSPGAAETDPERYGQARREGLQLFPSALAHSGMLKIDRFLLAGLASTAALGLYASVATMTEVLAWPMLAYADSRLGRWREDHDAGRLRLRRILVGVAAYSVVAAVVVGAAITFLMVPLLGPDYAPATSLVPPLIAAAVVFGVSQIVISLLIACRRNTAASVVEMLGFGLSLVAYVVLIGPYGAAGAAYGSLLGYLGCLVAAVVVLIRVRRTAS